MRTTTLLRFAAPFLLVALGLQAAPVDDRIAEGRAALAAHNLSLARSKFIEARAADSSNQTAAALLGLTRWFALVGDAPANGVLTGLGVSASGRDLYDWNASIAEDAKQNVVLPANYNLEAQRPFWRDTVVPTAAAVRADFAAVTDDAFTLTLTAQELNSADSITIDRADLLALQAGLRAFEMLVQAGLGQNFSGNYARLLQLAQGDTLTLRQALEENPDLFRAGPLENRLAAKAALLDFVNLYRRASSAIRARPAGLDRLFMLETPQDFNDEADFRRYLGELEKAATDYVELDKGEILASLAPTFTAGWSLRGALPPMTNGRFDPLTIADSSFGGVGIGVPRESFASLMVELGYTADLGWTQLNPTPLNSQLQKYVHTGTHHLVTGTNGTLGRSADGTTWTFQQFTNAQDLFSIATNGAGVVVAVGNTQVWRSADHGATWRQVHTTWRENNPDNEAGMFGLVWDGAKFLAITNGGYTWSSPDGATWTRGNRIAPQPTLLNIIGLDFSAGRFVAGGTITQSNVVRGAIFTSTDGSNWTQSFTSAASGFYRTAAFGNGRWVASAQGGRVAYSTNGGTTWAEVVPGVPTDAFAGMTYANGQFVMAGPRVATSPDGITWSFLTNPESIGFSDAVDGPGGIYLPGPQGALYRLNGTTFTRLDSNSSFLPRNSGLNEAVAFNGKLYLVGGGGTVYESTNGQTFTARQTPTTNALVAITVHNGALYASGANGTVVSSTDGANWQVRISGDTTLTTTSLNEIASVNGQLIAGGGGVVLTSPNGTAWTRRSLSPPGGSVFALAYGGGNYVAGLGAVLNAASGMNETAVAYSTDGITWSRFVVTAQPTSVPQVAVRQVLFDDGAFLLYLSNGELLRSNSSNPAHGFYGVDGGLRAMVGGAKFDGTYVATTQRLNDESRSGFNYSFDGETWVLTDLPTSEFSTGTTAVFNQRIYTAGASAVYRANRALARPAPAAGAPVVIPGRVGQSVRLAAPITASEELTYQWSYNGTAILGATGASLNLTQITSAQAGTYTVTATGRSTGQTTTNTVTLLVVAGAPTITQQPTGGLATVGQSFTLAVGASGSGTLAYQWFRNNVAVSGATSATLTLPSVTTNDAGNYRVEVTNANGSVISSDARVSVTALGVAPAFWDDSESIWAPSRLIHDNQGRFYAMWNVQVRNQDVIGGVNAGSLARYFESSGAIDPGFVWDERLGSPLFMAIQSDGKLLVAVNHAFGEGATVVRVNPNGSHDTSYVAPRFDRSIRFLTLQPDGKLLVAAVDNSSTGSTPAGTINVVNPTVYRLEANGAMESSATFTPVVFNGVVFAPPVLDASGRIYFAGQYTTVNGVNQRGIARTSAAGVLETGFANPTSTTTMPAGWGNFNHVGRGIGIQSDGKVVVVGRFAYTGRGNFSSDPIVAVRFTEAGAFDSSFAQPIRSQIGVNTSYSVFGRWLLMDANDKFLANFDRILRFNADGTLDNTWLGATQAYTKEIFWLSRSPSTGNLFFPDMADSEVPGNIANLTPSGARITSFNTGGFGSSRAPATAIILPDGRLIAGGNFDHFGGVDQPGSSLFSTNGLLSSDATPFHDPAVTYTNPYAQVFSWPDGSFGVLRGSQGDPFTGLGFDYTVRRFNPDGTARAGWELEEPSIHNWNYVPLNDGSLALWRANPATADLLSGGASAWVRFFDQSGRRASDAAANFSAFFLVTRDGSSAITNIQQGFVSDVQTSGDGSLYLLAAGRDGQVAVRKYSPLGAPDPAFTVTSLGAATVTSGFTAQLTDPVRNTTGQYAITNYTIPAPIFMRVLPDGSVYLVGSLNIGGVERAFARLNPNGTVDTSVADIAVSSAHPLGLNPRVSGITLDDSGRLYVAGRFDTVNGTATPGLGRFNRDGTLDTTWTPGVVIRDQNGLGVRMVAGRGWLHILGPVAGTNDPRPVGYKRIAIAPTAPVIAGQSASRTVSLGDTLQLYAGVFGGGDMTYQWTRNGTPILGASTPFLDLGKVKDGTASTYVLTATNSLGTTQTTGIVISVSNQPAILAAPASTTVREGSTATFTVVAASESALSYQWYFGTEAITGATSSALTLPNVALSAAGAYKVAVTNAHGTVESAAATLTVTARPTAPTITQQPQSQTVFNGYNVALGVAVTPPSGATITRYDWFQNNAIFSTQTASLTTSSTITVAAPAAGSSNSYYVVVTTSNGGTVTSNTATVTASSVPYAVSTLAGLSTRGVNDGTGSGARFANPQGAVGDGNGNLYVADANNHTIRRVTSAGVVTTFAGAALQSGATNGTLTAARFSSPQGLALDSAGNLYVAGGNLIRKISGGNVTTLAGSGVAGSVDGTGTAATFNFPMRLAVNSAGDVFVADVNNHKIRKVTAAGVVTTYAGSGVNGSSDNAVATAATFSGPRGLALTPDGTLFVVDSAHTIRRIGTDGVVTTVAGSPNSNSITDGVGTAARFSNPQDLYYDAAAAHLYVVDGGNTVRRIEVANNYTVTTIAGTGFNPGFADGTGAAARFNFPRSLGWMGNGFGIVDSNSNTIRFMTTAGVVTTLAGMPPGSNDGTGSAARFYTPEGLARDSAGNLYVADANNRVIRKISPSGAVTLFSGIVSVVNGDVVDGAAGVARYVFPRSLALDPAAGVLYVFDSGTIRKVLLSDGSVTTLAGLKTSYGAIDSATPADARFGNSSNPLALAANGDLYMADVANHTIRKITPAGVVTTVAGVASASASVDGSLGSDPATSVVRFASPQAIAIDSAGNIFVAQNNGFLRRIDTAGNVTTVTGHVGSGQLDGVAPFARLVSASSMAFGPDGNLYVGGNSAFFQRVTPASEVTTLAGSFTAGYLDAAGSSARMDVPNGLIVGPDGVIYSSDRNNGVIRRAIAAPAITFTTNPASQTVATGANVTFTAAATGVSGIAYQWTRNGVDLSGQTGASLTLSNVTTANNGTYAVRASSGLSVAVSSNASLTVVDPVANDSFANATLLAAGLTGGVTGTNVGATGESGEPVHFNSNTTASSVWWIYRPLATGVATFSTSGSAFDTAMAIYSGSSLSSLAFLAQNNDAPGSTQSRIVLPVTAGTTYYIAVGSNTATRGAISLQHSLEIAPQPGVLALASNQTGALSVEPGGSFNPAVTVQWRRDGADISGATSATLGSITTAGVYTPAFAQGGALDASRSLSTAVLIAPVGGTVAADTFNTTGLGSAWNQNQSASFPDTDTAFVVNERLEFTTSNVTPASANRQVERTATLPLDRTWSVVVRAAVDPAMLPAMNGTGSTRETAIALVATSPTNSSTFHSLVFRYRNDTGTPTLQSFMQTTTSGSVGQPLGLSTPVRPTVLLRFDYDPATGLITSFVSRDGNAFSALGTTNVLGSWGLSRTAALKIGLRGNAESVAVPAAAVWADDFATVVAPIPAPVITAQPSGATIADGSVRTLSVTLSGTTAGTPTYQWFKDGVAVAGATFSTFNANAAGSYTVNVTLNGITVTSQAAVIATTPSAPTFGPLGNLNSVFGSGGLALPAGSSSFLQATPTAGSAPLTYRWFKDGVELPGVTGNTYYLPDWQPANQGAYSVTATNSLGSATSPAEMFWVTPEGGWRWRNPTPTGNGATRVVFLNGQFLVGGIRGTLLVSNDGVNWATRQVPAQNNLFNFQFVGGRYLAMASLNGIFSSPDAITWTPRTTGINGALTSLQDMVAGNGRVVALGVGGVTAISTDGGDTWTPGTLGSGITDTLFGATFVLNKYLGVSGENGRVFSSADGVTWSAVATPATAGLRALAYGAGRLVAVGTGGAIVTSTNGTSWTLQQSGTTNQLIGVNFVNGRFVAVGILGTILTSPDGLVWTARSAQGNQSNLQNTAFGNGRYVIAGQGGRVLLTSTDGDNWSILTGGPAQGFALFGAAASSSTAVAVGQSGTILSSTDKVTWTSRTNSGSPNLNQLNDVTYAQNKFMAVGGTGSVMTSADEGASWTWQSFSNVLTSNALQGVRYSPLANLWVIVANGGAIYTSPDGATFTWTLRSSGTTQQLRKVAVGSSLHVAVGASGVVATSPDAVTWTLSTSTTSNQLNDVAFGNGKWIAVGVNGTVLTSTDGTTWNSMTLGLTNLFGVTFQHGHFIATGTSNGYFTSTDGVNWTGRTTGAADSLNDTVTLGNELVGVGAFGTILTAGLPSVAGGGTITANTLSTVDLKFAVGNSPFPVTYQWFKDGQPISGPNGPVLRLASVATGDAGAYHLTATNSFGTATSSTLTLSTNVSISISAQPQPQTATVGGSATFSVTASGVPTPSYQWRLNGTAIPGATASSVTLTNLRLSDAGPVTVVLSNGVGSSVTSNAAQLTVQPIAPVITSPLSAFAVANVPFTYQIVTNQTPATFAASGLPSGLTLNTTTGVISGVPTQVGTASVQLSATNGTGSDNKALTLTVQPPAPMITSAASTSGRVGVSFSYTITATNSPSGFLSASLPPGLSRTGAVISGTPTTAGYFTSSIAAFNDTGIAQQPLVIQIAPALNAPVFSGNAFQSATAGTAYTFTPNFGSGVTGYALVNLPDGTASVLPNGITLNSTTGVISGTTTQTGTYRIALRATNADGSTTQVLTFTFNPAASAPLLTSNSSAVATVGSLFTFTLTSNPLATSYGAAGLPSGLTLNESSGVISGIPTEPGIVAVTITATNGTGSSTALLTLTINSSPLAPVLTSAPVASGTVGVEFGFQLAASNTPTAFSVSSGTLPAGLALNGTTGAITGTPTAAGQTRVWLAASNAAGGRGPAVEVLFNIARALNVPAITSNGTAAGQVGQPFQYQITATNTPTSYGATPLPNGLAFDSATGVISGLPSTETTTPFAITLTASNNDGSSAPKTLSVTIAPPAATPRITSPGTAGGRAGVTFNHQLTASDNPTSFASDQLPDGLSLNATTGLISGTPVAAGTTTVQVRAANTAGLGQASPLTLTIASPLSAPAITSEPTTSGKVGVLFSYQIVATGTPTVFGLSGTLPGGLSFNTSTGVISGNPADAPGLYEVTLTATNSAGTSQPQSLFISIAPADAVPVITSATSAAGMVNTAFTYQITATNVPSTTPFPPSTFLDAIGLPDGLAVNPSTGLIQGTPSTAGTYTVSLVGVNSNGTGLPRSLTVVISPAATAPVVNSGTSASAQVGTAFSYQITATNSPTAFEALDAPAWMTVNTVSGLLSGTPTAPGPIALQLAASNSAGASNYVTLTLSIAAAPNTPVITSSQSASGRVSQSFSYDLTATLTPTSYRATGLPPGLTFDSANGQIRGTPTASGTFSVTVSGVNANGQGQPVTLTLTILPSLSING